MADKIVIEGNTVVHVTETIQTVSSLDTFVSELVKIRPVSVGILPIGCLAVEVLGGKRGFHIFLDHGIYKLSNTVTRTKSTVFLPPSVFSIYVGPKQNVVKMYWHFVEERPKGDIFQTKVYLNMLPNIDPSNGVCFGEAGFTIDPNSTIQAVVDAAIDSVLSSNFNMDYLSDKASSSLIGIIEEYTREDRKGHVEKAIEKLTEEIQEIENKDWTKFSPTQQENSIATLKALGNQRAALIREYSTTDHWYKYFLSYLEYWTNRNMEDITKAPKKASLKFLQEICSVTGTIVPGRGGINRER